MRDQKLREVVEVLESTVSANSGRYRRFIGVVADLKKQVDSLSAEVESLKAFVRDHRHSIPLRTVREHNTSAAKELKFGLEPMTLKNTEHAERVLSEKGDTAALHYYPFVTEDECSLPKSERPKWPEIQTKVEGVDS